MRGKFERQGFFFLSFLLGVLLCILCYIGDLLKELGIDLEVKGQFSDFLTYLLRGLHRSFARLVLLLFLLVFGGKPKPSSDPSPILSLYCFYGHIYLLFVCFLVSVISAIYFSIVIGQAIETLVIRLTLRFRIFIHFIFLGKRILQFLYCSGTRLYLILIHFLYNLDFVVHIIL